MSGEAKFWLFIIAVAVFCMTVAGFSAVLGHMRDVYKRDDT